MVVLYSIDLTKPIITASVYAVLGFVILFVYMKIVPNFEKHWRRKMWLESAVMVVIITSILSFLIWPDYLNHSIWYDLFQERQISTGAHNSSYLIVLLLVAIPSIYYDDWIKGLAYGAASLFYHESIWFLFYYLTYPVNLNYVVDSGFAFFMVVLWYVGHKTYSFKISKTAYLIYVFYVLAWVGDGFPISVTNKFESCANIYCAKVLGATPFYGDFFTNAIESGSWIVLGLVLFYSIRLNKNVIPRRNALMGLPFFSKNRKSLNFSYFPKRSAIIALAVAFVLIGIAIPFASNPVFGFTNPIVSKSSTSCAISAGSNTCTTAGLSVTAGDTAVLTTYTSAGGQGCFSGTVVSSDGSPVLIGVTVPLISGGGTIPAGTIVQQDTIWYSSILTTTTESFIISLNTNVMAGSQCTIFVNIFGGAPLQLQSTGLDQQFEGSSFTHSISFSVTSYVALVVSDAQTMQPAGTLSWARVTSGQGLGSANSISGCGLALGQCISYWLANTGNPPFGSVSSTVTCSGGCGLGYSDGVSIAFSLSGATVANQICVGSCPTATNSASGTYIVRNELYYYVGQAGPNGATITNFTTFVNAVHINSTTQSLYMLIYRANGVPNAGSQWQQAYTSQALTITNGSTNQRFSPAGLAITLTSGQYFAISIMTSASHSNSATVTNSGVSIAQSTAASLSSTQTFATGSKSASFIPPLTFWSVTTATPALYINAIETLSTVTITTTASTTITGVITSTTTTTTTSTNIINQSDPSKATFWMIPLIFWLMPTALLMEWARRSNAPPSVWLTLILIGLTVGSVLGAMAGVTPFPFALLFGSVLIVVIWRNRS